MRKTNLFIFMLLVLTLVFALSSCEISLANGKDGATPSIRINDETKMWEVSYDNGMTWTSLESLAIADEQYEGTPGLAFYLMDDETYAVSAGTAIFLSEIEIPSVYKNKPVTAIAAGSFKNSTGKNSVLKKITLPEGITNIGDCAFESCVNLESISIPSSVTEIGKHAFRDCERLCEVTLPEGTRRIGEGAFSGCVALESVTLPETLEVIEDGAFSFCGKLAEVINKSSLNIIKGRKRYGEVGINAVLIHSGESRIAIYGSYKFITDNDGKSYLLSYIGEESEIKLPAEYNGNEYDIFSCAFYKNKTLTEVLIPEGVEEIGFSAFSGAENLSRVTLPDSLKSIGEDAFFGAPVKEASIPAMAAKQIDNPELINVTFTSGERIEEYSFVNSFELERVTLPIELRFIGDGAFSNCKKLVEIINQSLIEIEKGYSEYGNIARYALNIHNGESKITVEGSYKFITDSEGKKYLFKYDGSEGDLVLPEGDENGYYINRFAFSENEDIVSVTFPREVKGIGDYAFYNCKGLERLTLPSGLKLLGNGAFSGCEGLSSAVISEGVEIVGSEAFLNCLSLEELILPRSVKIIADNAFLNCESLRVYYKGTKEDRNAMGVSDLGNESLDLDRIFYYSETEPEQEGNYWRFIGDVPTVWKKDTAK